jgi:hypothetical protein
MPRPRRKLRREHESRELTCRWCEEEPPNKNHEAECPQRPSSEELRKIFATTTPEQIACAFSAADGVITLLQQAQELGDRLNPRDLVALTFRSYSYDYNVAPPEEVTFHFVTSDGERHTLFGTDLFSDAACDSKGEIQLPCFDPGSRTVGTAVTWTRGGKCFLDVWSHTHAWDQAAIEEALQLSPKKKDKKKDK